MTIELGRKFCVDSYIKREFRENLRVVDFLIAGHILYMYNVCIYTLAIESLVHNTQHNIAIKMDLKRNTPVKLLKRSKISLKFTDLSSICVSYHQKANCARLCSLDKPSNEV